MNSMPSASEAFGFRHLDYVIAVAETGRTAAAIATIAAIQDLLIAGPPDVLRWPQHARFRQPLPGANRSSRAVIGRAPGPA